MRNEATAAATSGAQEAYPVEVSGWDDHQNFFVEKTELHWSEAAGKHIVLQRPVPFWNAGVSSAARSDGSGSGKPGTVSSGTVRRRRLPTVPGAVIASQERVHFKLRGQPKRGWVPGWDRCGRVVPNRTNGPQFIGFPKTCDGQRSPLGIREDEPQIERWQWLRS